MWEKWTQEDDFFNLIKSTDPFVKLIVDKVKPDFHEKGFGIKFIPFTCAKEELFNQIEKLLNHN